jgi:tRNA pseudouridine38-40 synthase
VTPAEAPAPRGDDAPDGRPPAPGGALRRIRLLVEYHGAAYCGWQVQPNGPTVQGALEDAVAALTGEARRVEGAGRTDSGVHAAGMTAHFDTASTLPAERFARALNAHLPKDISVRASAGAAPGFHARFSAAGKVYRYAIDNHPARPALDRDRLWWVSWTLDDERLRAASAHIVGTHDFTSFTDGERAGEDNVRTVTRAEWTREGARLVFTVEGGGFLYKMVRILVGTLVECGRGPRDPDAIPATLAARDRAAAGPTAPPQGLTLLRVVYPEGT